MTKLVPVPISWRAQVVKSELTSTQKHVALTLSLYMGELGESAHPGPARLAHDTGLHHRTIQAALAALELAGWVVCVARGGMVGEKRKANTYEARVPTVQGHPSLSPTHGPERADPRSSMQLPTVQDQPISPVISPVISPAASTDKPPRKRDLIFDCLCELTRTDPVGLTNAGRGSLNRACKELRAVSAEPDEIRKRWSALHRRYPNAALTAPALVKHWAALGTNPKLPNLAVVRTIEEDRAEFAELMGETL